MADGTMSRPIVSRKEARKSGLSRYYTGVPCKHGHYSDRSAKDSTCIACRDARTKAWAEANADRAKANRDRWRAENRERDLVAKRRYAEANKERTNARSREYYRANAERHGALTRRWKQQHPEECTVMSYNSRARRFGWRGPFMTIDIYRAMSAQQSGHCAYCGAIATLVFEHVQALARGGGYEPGNVVLACRKCNHDKITDPLDVFLDRLPSLRPNAEWTATAADIDLLTLPRRRP